MSWFEVFSSMGEGKLKKHNGSRYYVYKHDSDMIGAGPNIKIVSPTKMSTERAKSQMIKKLNKLKCVRKPAQVSVKRKSKKTKKEIKKTKKKSSTLKKKVKNKKMIKKRRQ